MIAKIMKELLLKAIVLFCVSHTAIKEKCVQIINVNGRNLEFHSVYVGNGLIDTLCIDRLHSYPITIYKFYQKFYNRLWPVNLQFLILEGQRIRLTWQSI